MVFSINQSAVLAFSHDVSVELKHYLLPGDCRLVEATDQKTQLLLQQCDLPSCQYTYAVYHLPQPARIEIHDEGPFLHVYLALQQERRLTIKGLPSLRLRDGQFNMIHAPEFDVLSEYESGRDAITLFIRYDLAILQEWATELPELVLFLEKVKAGQPAVLFETSRWIDRAIQESLYHVTHTSRKVAGYAAYSDLLVRTLLYHLLFSSTNGEFSNPYTHLEFNNLHAARDLIRDNIRRHLTIRDIARKVGINEFKLKNGFRELFGNGLYEYLRIERMQEALHLFDDPHISIKEVATKTGYKSVPSFIKAFRKQFGKAPGEYRKSK